VTAPHPAGDPVRRLARAVLTAAVRGRRPEGGPWGEAALAEFAHTTGRWEAVRWSAGGVRAALRERRARHRELPRRVRARRRVIGLAAAAALAGLGTQQWVLTPMYSPSTAMAPTLSAADNWLMDRVSFRLTGLRYGDVVAFERTAGDTSFTDVRRVVGLPGDVISCAGGHLLRNGTAVAEPRGAAGCPSLTVPAGSVYVLGDNRSVADDSRPVVSTDRVEGRLLTRLWNGGPDGSPWAPRAPTA